MRKFILIDQSIQDAGGHHLEYALRVLKAAKSAGFQSILGTHKKCGIFRSEYVDVVDNAFTHTFWENHHAEFAVPKRRKWRLLDAIEARKNQLIHELMSSSVGFSYVAAAQGLSLRDIFSRYGMVTSGKRLSSGTILIGYWLYRLEKIQKGVTKRIGRLLHTTEKVRRSAGMVFGGLAGLIFWPIGLLYLLIRFNRVYGYADIYTAQFAQDIQRLLIRISASEGDIIFIPTLGNIELIGSGFCAVRLPVQNLGWHFLFRRNVFKGRELSYQAQIEEQFKTPQAFFAYKLNASNQLVNFYTDTNALTEQYNRLGAFKFTTLPIPLDESIKRARRNGERPANITYLGDARDEKGFHLLARLVGDLRAAGYTESQIQFTLQSNFNVPEGEPRSRIAKAQLSAESPDLVHLVEGPLESEHYASLINNSDVLLIPYDSNNYYARSSGIFAEALVAGIPVVAADKSWMSQELFDLNQSYYRTLFESTRILHTTFLDNPSTHSNLVVRPRSGRDWCWLLVAVTQRTRLPGAYLHVRWRTHPYTILKADKGLSCFRQINVDLRSTSAYGLMRLPMKERILLEFQVDGGIGNVLPLAKYEAFGLSLSVHELDMERNVPFFYACPLYSLEEDFSTAVIEVLENYEQYSKHSLALSKTWKDFHNSEVLVKMLDANRK